MHYSRPLSFYWFFVWDLSSLKPNISCRNLIKLYVLLYIVKLYDFNLLQLYYIILNMDFISNIIFIIVDYYTVHETIVGYTIFVAG